MPELAKLVATASTSLSKQIVNMKADPAQLVSALEEIEVKTKQSIIQRILAWLEGFLKWFESPLFPISVERLPNFAKRRQVSYVPWNHTPLIPGVRMNKQ